MKHLHRDNFRHLTGLGRDMADYLDRALVEAGCDENGHLSGDLTITHLVDTNEWLATVADHPKFDDGKPTHSLLTIAERRGLRVEMIMLPLMLVVTGTKDFSGDHVLYRHRFGAAGTADCKADTYIGITKRGWRTRWAEHVRAANSGSHYRFHQAIRRWQNIDAGVTSHFVMACGMSEQQAFAMEEKMVAAETLYPLGLNMVPGGNAGLAYLRKIGAIGVRERIAADDRQYIINRFFERTSRKGTPNPLAAANWLNPNYAESVICAGTDRMKPQQIRDARFLSSLGQSADTIAQQVGARNIEQIQRLLSGVTYSRIS